MNADKNFFTDQGHRVRSRLTCSHGQQVDGNLIGQALPPSFVGGQTEEREVGAERAGVVDIRYSDKVCLTTLDEWNDTCVL
jgi:hypothetical protein